MVLAVYAIKYGVFWLVLLFAAYMTYTLLMSMVPFEPLKTYSNYYHYQAQTEGQFVHSSEVLAITKCLNVELETRVAVDGDHWVFQNFVGATERFECFESITYTTQADYTFLHNLIPLAERWRGPISVAVYAPGDDFEQALRSIAWLRICETPLIRRYVTFHLFMETAHFPTVLSKKINSSLIDSYETLERDYYTCNQDPPYLHVNETYKSLKQLTYPINVARNLARKSAQTHFVFASDIELYPTPDFIAKFLNMVVRMRDLFESDLPKIFVLPVFEIPHNETVPDSKSGLQDMYVRKRAFWFHYRLCKPCHAIPRSEEWIADKEGEKLGAFATVKRKGQFRVWEAFYVGTNKEPLFDERLVWEGQRNKMTQAYIMCLLDYDYIVLDNAFLIHKPGIKKHKTQLMKYMKEVGRTNRLMSSTIKPQIISMYGKRNGCQL